MEAFPPEAAAALDAFGEAAGRPQAYLQPSKPVAELARLAAKVGLLWNLFSVAHLHMQTLRQVCEFTTRISWVAAAVWLWSHRLGIISCISPCLTAQSRKQKLCRKSTCWHVHWQCTCAALSQAAACARLAAPNRLPLIPKHDEPFHTFMQAYLLQPALPAEA